MEHIIRENRERWNVLAEHKTMHSRPFLDFTREDAERFVYGSGLLPDVAGKRVLCLANGGGMQSVAFGLVGARVTVFDLSDVQLERDREAAAHHRLSIETIQGDMRDLSVFADNTFDLVIHGGLNYCPAVEQVLREAVRVLRPGGCYDVMILNPFTQALDEESWDGTGYRLRGLYRDGEEVTPYHPIWEEERPDGVTFRVKYPHEFRHRLSTVVNTLISNGFILMHLGEWMRNDDPPEPGSWPYFTQMAPPFLSIFCRLEK